MGLPDLQADMEDVTKARARTEDGVVQGQGITAYHLHVIAPQALATKDSLADILRYAMAPSPSGGVQRHLAVWAVEFIVTGGLMVRRCVRGALLQGGASVCWLGQTVSYTAYFPGICRRQRAARHATRGRGASAHGA